MKKNPIITYSVLDIAPRAETGAYNVGWPPAPDLVEASDQIVWSENHSTLLNIAYQSPIMVPGQSTS